MTDAPPHLCPRWQDLDDLDVLRRGLYGDGARMRPLPVPDDVAGDALAAGALVVVDPEGVPVARLTSLAATGSGTLTGDPEWLSPMSSRPFQDLHLHGPVDLSAHEVVVVTAPGSGSPPLPDGVRLLVLASTSLDEDTTGNDTVRAAVAAARSTPGARVSVVPVPLGDTDRRAALLATLGVARADGADPSSAGAAAAPSSAAQHAGVTVLLTGLSGSGKSTIARAVATRLVEEGTSMTLLDGDRVRRHLTAGLGFSPADRDTNVRRIGWVAAEVSHHGGTAICSPIAPNDVVRREVAAMVTARGGRFVLVHVATPLQECERRDRKGLYAAARRGDIPDFTGVSAPYDVPESPDLRVDTTGRTVAECADLVLALVHGSGGTRA